MKQSRSILPFQRRPTCVASLRQRNWKKTERKGRSKRLEYRKHVQRRRPARRQPKVRMSGCAALSLNTAFAGTAPGAAPATGDSSTVGTATSDTTGTASAPADPSSAARAPRAAATISQDYDDEARGSESSSGGSDEEVDEDAGSQELVHKEPLAKDGPTDENAPSSPPPAAATSAADVSPLPMLPPLRQPPTTEAPSTPTNSNPKQTQS